MIPQAQSASHQHLAVPLLWITPALWSVSYIVALIYAASPVLIALGAVRWLGERFSWRQGLGVGIAMTGVFHVVVKGQWTSLAQVQWTAGDGWIVLAMLSWAGTTLWVLA